MTSQTARRPRPSGRLTSTCVMTAIRLCAEEALGLLALVGRQRVDHAVDGLDGARRVERAEHEVSGLGGGHRHRDRLGVAHLADQDHVRVLAHRRAHAFCKGGQVRAELALHDLALLAAVDELDRVLEADDVEFLVGVQQVDHRRERRRLAGAGRARHQDHPLVVVAQLPDNGRQRERVQRRHLGRDRAEHRADAGILAEHVDAETAAFLRHIGEIDVVAGAEPLGLVPRQDLGDVRLELREQRARGTGSAPGRRSCAASAARRPPGGRQSSPGRSRASEMRRYAALRRE